MASVEPLKGMADLLILQQRLRQIQDLTELFSFLVNDTRMLFSYRSALLLDNQKLAAVSGLPSPEGTASFTQWIERLAKEQSGRAGYEIEALSAASFSAEIADEWSNYLPEHLLWIPLISPDYETLGVLLLTREGEWQPQEQRILSNWAGAAGHAIEALKLKKASRWRSLINWRDKKLWLAACFGMVVAMFIPVRISVIAPAEIVPTDPIVVRAPLEGVIGEVHIEPNQAVSEGDLLLSLDEAALQARLDVATQELEVAKSEYLRAEQASIVDRNASAQIYMLNARIEQRQAEVEYVQELMSRIDVQAEASGLAIINDITELEGRPVALGEQILTIADPDRVELEAWLPVDDSLPVAPGAEVRLYLNIAPNNPVVALLQRTDYQAQVSPDGILAFRVRARIPADSDREQDLRIGLRGSARIYGERAPLYYLILRRPLAKLRQILGV